MWLHCLSSLITVIVSIFLPKEIVSENFTTWNLQDGTQFTISNDRDGTIFTIWNDRDGTIFDTWNGQDGRVFILFICILLGIVRIGPYVLLDYD